MNHNPEAVQQYNAEVGDSELKKEQIMILRMKYGIIAAQLTPSENYLIQKEERKLARRKGN